MPRLKITPKGTEAHLGKVTGPAVAEEDGCLARLGLRRLLLLVMRGQLTELLSRGLPDGRLVTDPDVLASMSHDDAEWAPAGRAAGANRGHLRPLRLSG